MFWDPRALGLGKEDDAGQRQQKILSVDDKGIVAKLGIDQHAAWKERRRASVEASAIPSRVVRTVTELKDDASAAPNNVLIEATQGTRHARPHGKRFGILVHAMLAAVPLESDASKIADAARIQARIIGASEEEAIAARDVVAAALAHPLLARARAAERVERETALMHETPAGEIIEGVVDLAFLEKGAGWTVVDFKTDIEIAGRKEQYVRQIDAYARAIAAATGEPARGALLAV